MVLAYIGQRGKDFRSAVRQSIIDQFGRDLRPTSHRVRVEIVVHGPDRRARDIDNLTKAALDALTHAQVWEDDSQIDELHVVRGTARPGSGCLDVTIEALPETEVQRGLFAGVQAAAREAST